MKLKYKKQNSPRLANAIRRACEYAHANSGWWHCFRADDLGAMIYQIAYKADKYDVLNRLCPGIQRTVVTFARGDIRHRKQHVGLLELLLLLLTAILFSNLLSRAK